MGDLPGRVDPDIRPPGDRDARRLLGPAEDCRERRLELALHGAQPGLPCPAGEVRAVVGDVESDPNGLHQSSLTTKAPLPGGAGPSCECLLGVVLDGGLLCGASSAAVSSAGVSSAAASVVSSTGASSAASVSTTSVSSTGAGSAGVSFGVALAAAAFVDDAGFFTTGSSTSSMTAMGALSPLR